MKNSVFVGALALAGLSAGMAAADTLADVKARGKLNCGTNTGLVGFAAPYANGEWQGFDVAICKAVALAHGGRVWALNREFAVAMLNGVAWATVVGIVAFLWFRSWKIAAVIFAAMIVNLVAAALAGVLVPLGLRRFGVDPAVAGGVVVTTVTDVVGFASLLGLGTLVLL